MPNASGGLGSQMPTPYYKKIQRQRNRGNMQKAKNLTYRYRARVANNPAVQAQLSQTGSSTPSRLQRRFVARGLKKYAPGQLKKFRRNQPAAPGTPGGTY